MIWWWYDDCEIRVAGYLTKTEEEAAEEELCEEFVGVDADADGRAAVHGADDKRTNEFDAGSQWNEDRSPASMIKLNVMPLISGSV